MELNQTKYETVDMSEYLIITYIQYSLTDECMEDKDNIDKEFEEKNQSHKISHFISDNVHIVIEGYNQGFSSYTGKEVVLDRSYDVDSIKDSIVLRINFFFFFPSPCTLNHTFLFF